MYIYVAYVCVFSHHTVCVDMVVLDLGGKNRGEKKKRVPIRISFSHHTVSVNRVVLDLETQVVV